MIMLATAVFGRLRRLPVTLEVQVVMGGLQQQQNISLSEGRTKLCLLDAQSMKRM